MNATQNQRAIGPWSERLRDLGFAVRQRIREAQRAGSDMAEQVAHEGGDAIFAIDRDVEQTLVECIQAWDDALPVAVVAEGMGEDGIRQIGDGTPTHRLLIDPIDGTRNIMYDKRSAWFIAAVAPDRGAQTMLSDCIASMLVELPVTRQSLGLEIFAEQDFGVGASIEGDATHALVPAVGPSRATSLRNGFAQVSNFFPGVKTLAGELMEAIAEADLGPVAEGSATVFDDQYISSAGQMIELMLGHDRFCCDLRPLLYDVRTKQTGDTTRGHVCHPYDIAGAYVASACGVIMTDGLGNALDAPFDVHAPVHWCGYANETIRARIEPVIIEWLARRGVV